MQGFAAGTYPVVKRVRPEQFTQALSTAEIALGSALLVPVSPDAIGGTALGAFTAGLLGLYMKTPGMRRSGSLRPTEYGLPLSKDVWMTSATGSPAARPATEGRKGRGNWRELLRGGRAHKR